MKIGFIGTGVMGTGIIKNMLKQGNQVTVYNRTKQHAKSVLDSGAIWAETPSQATENQEAVFTMVGYPQDVEEVYFGKNGILSVATGDQILVDMTTSTPSLAQRIGHYAEKQGLKVIDAPVSGGDIGAQNATLTIMVGGNRDAYNQLEDVFNSIGQRHNYFGTYGAGQHAKMANQIMIAGTMTGLTEMLVYAKKANLNLPMVLETLSSGGADNWSMETYVPRILRNDYTPGFFAKHFLKDLRIAIDEAQKMEIELPATMQAKQLYEQLVDEKGLGDDGTQALVKLWWQK
ncbi:NAD(P)-dependent oxidoreductase [Paucilactobacillus suebicus]|uniref:3-hydroxyisobutyrate dehydrogenase n=1 Tax=Paucilactobacillus suebicus DSM 5007 = KCTC 3549 TaxID=1423807 RepID=A0A0R1WAV3_9LACO|nr:NAD(P)-dependent oxidoreductase [Paucilactobacillus suebicus]KRM12996.1 3-hydroxyisobutyrate dehydrogenase [Paucilactobacillus suebicus DSM 5007 = KCTC 3549]